MHRSLITLVFALLAHAAMAGAIIVPGACSQNSITGRDHVAWDGDSYQLHATNHAGSAVPTASNFTSPATDHASVSELDFLLGWPWYFDTELDNYGINGATSTTDLANMPILLAARHPHIVFIGGPHNDPISGIAFATSIANIQTMVALVKQCGAIPVLIIDPSINSNESSVYVTLQQERQSIIQLDNWERYYAADQGIATWDWFTPTINPADSTGAVLTSLTDDGIHPNGTGNFLIAQQGIKDLAFLATSPNTLSLATSQADAYNATYNIYGNLLLAPTFTTTTTAGGCATGTMPTSFTYACFNTPAGATIVGSSVASADGIANWQQLAITQTTTGGNVASVIDLQQNVTANVVPGNYIEGWVQVNVLANSPFEDVKAKIKCGANVAQGMNYAITDTQSNPGPTQAYSGVIYVPPIVVPASQTSCYMYMEVDYNSATTFSGTVQFRRPAMRIVQNPY